MSIDQEPLNEHITSNEDSQSEEDAHRDDIVQQDDENINDGAQFSDVQGVFPSTPTPSDDSSEETIETDAPSESGFDLPPIFII